MRKISEKIRMFMRGRYGIDSFGNFLLVVYAILCLINGISRTLILQIAALLIAFYFFFRTFSKNIYKRGAENRKFLTLWSKVKTEFKLLVDRFKYAKTDRFRKCKHCKAIIKLPNKKGSHTVRCPKCGEKFDVKIL